MKAVFVYAVVGHGQEGSCQSFSCMSKHVPVFVSKTLLFSCSKSGPPTTDYSDINNTKGSVCSFKACRVRISLKILAIHYNPCRVLLSTRENYGTRDINYETHSYFPWENCNTFPYFDELCKPLST